MTAREWHIETPICHTVRLEHGSLFSGRVKIFVDEKIVYQRHVTLLDWGFQQEINIDDQAYVVSARYRLFDYAYSFTHIGSADSFPAKFVADKSDLIMLLTFFSLFSFFHLALALSGINDKPLVDTVINFTIGFGLASLAIALMKPPVGTVVNGLLSFIAGLGSTMMIAKMILKMMTDRPVVVIVQLLSIGLVLYCSWANYRQRNG